MSPFQEALTRAMGNLSQVEVARKAGIAPSTLSTWLSGGGAKPDQVFAVERALNLPPGDLSRHLGYIPVSEQPLASVEAAVEADEVISAPQKDALVFLYTHFRSRSEDS